MMSKKRIISLVAGIALLLTVAGAWHVAPDAASTVNSHADQALACSGIGVGGDC